MATVKYTTELGTEITLSNIQSNSSFEILKTIVPIIDQVELAEQAGVADDLIQQGVINAYGCGGALILTGQPENLIKVDPEHYDDIVEFIEDLEDEDDDCGDPDCPVHGDGDDEDGDGFNTTDPLVQELVEVPYALIEAALDEFAEKALQMDPDKILLELNNVANSIRQLAEALPEDHPAASSIFSLGAGMNIALAWALYTRFAELKAERVAPKAA